MEQNEVEILVKEVGLFNKIHIQAKSPYDDDDYAIKGR
jgi:hypothetical protein